MTSITTSSSDARRTSLNCRKASFPGKVEPFWCTPTLYSIRRRPSSHSGTEHEEARAIGPPVSEWPVVRGGLGETRLWIWPRLKATSEDMTLVR